MPGRRTVRLIEIAEILNVTHQRTSMIVHQPGFPAPVGHKGSEPPLGLARGCGVGEGVAAGEAVGDDAF
jgi:hypothetical protein